MLWLISGLLIYFIGALVTLYLARFNERDGNDETFLAIVSGFWPFIPFIYVGIYLIRGIRLAAHKMDNWVAMRFKTLIHEDEYGKLYRLPYPQGRQRLVVRVEDSTGVYWLPVPTDINQRAKAAVAWTYRKEEQDFNPMRV